MPAMRQNPDAQALRFPRRTIRREETRARIVAAASRLFRQVGYAEATMASIAEAADVHVTTLFTHFKNKAELAGTLGEAAIAELADLIANAQGELPFFVFFRGVVIGAAQTYQNNSGPNIAFGHELRQDPELAYGWLIYQQRQIEMLAGYIASDYGLDVATDTRPMLIASLLVASNTLTHDQWLDSKGDHDLVGETIKSIELTQKMSESILPKP
jgi:AcrR family transcriptional regulator